MVCAHHGPAPAQDDVVAPLIVPAFRGEPDPDLAVGFRRQVAPSSQCQLRREKTELRGIISKASGHATAARRSREQSNKQLTVLSSWFGSVPARLWKPAVPKNSSCTLNAAAPERMGTESLMMRCLSSACAHN